MRSLLAIERADVCAHHDRRDRGRHRAGHQGRRCRRTMPARRASSSSTSGIWSKRTANTMKEYDAPTCAEDLSLHDRTRPCCSSPRRPVSAWTSCSRSSMTSTSQNHMRITDRHAQRHSGRGDGARAAAYRQGPPPASIYLHDAGLGVMSAAPSSASATTHACSTSRTSAIWKTRSARYSA